MSALARLLRLQSGDPSDALARLMAATLLEDPTVPIRTTAMHLLAWCDEQDAHVQRIESSAVAK